MKPIRIYLLCFLTVLGVSLTGCQSEKICDARGDTDICEIHHVIMQEEIVKNRNKNPTMPSQEYLAARAQNFRHSYPFLLPKECTSCAVNICPACVRAEELWMRQNQGH